jgi:polyhydroxyalkanoate synthesis repressor PhaR
MPQIKRYPNRKLYDTEAKRYVSLEGVAELIRQGQDVCVLEHTTGEDITSLILVQIVAERERRYGSGLPTSLLAGLIQAGEQTLSAVRRGVTDSLRALDFLRQVDEEIERRVERLIERGELDRETGSRLIAQLANEPTDGNMPLAAPDVATRSEIQRLSAQLDALNAALDDLAGRVGPRDEG